MPFIALAIGLVLTLGGLAGLVWPGLLVALARHTVSPAGLFIVAAVRVGIGTVFLLGARRSRWPGTVRILGVIAVIAGLATLLIGVDRANAMLSWWLMGGSMFVRITALFAAALGGFITYAVTSARKPA